MMFNAPIDFALAYAAAGYKVIPANGKIPLVQHGAHDSSADEATIRQWWTKWPNANIGLALDGLVAVDIDPRNGGDVDLLPHRLPDTCFAKTGGGGFHYLFRSRNGTRYAGKLAPGIDLKHGAGSYIVVEPSLDFPMPVRHRFRVRNETTSLSAELESAVVRALMRAWHGINYMHFREGLKAPTLRLSDVESRLGQWSAGPRTIEIARRMVLSQPWGVVIEVLKHEMAHQYAHEVLGATDETAHGEAFRRTCERLAIDQYAGGGMVLAALLASNLINDKAANP